MTERDPTSLNRPYYRPEWLRMIHLVQSSFCLSRLWINQAFAFCRNSLNLFLNPWWINAFWVRPGMRLYSIFGRCSFPSVTMNCRSEAYFSIVNSQLFPVNESDLVPEIFDRKIAWLISRIESWAFVGHQTPSSQALTDLKIGPISNTSVRIPQ